MALRVTQGMMQAQLLKNLSSNARRMSDTQNVLSTGRKLNKPSDDPVGVTYALRYRSEISITDQYQKNLTVAKSSIDHLDTVLSQLNDVIHRANELTVQGVNGTNPQTALDAISVEMGELYEHAVSIGNEQLNGKFIFNGQLTDKQPYTSANASTVTTDNGSIDYQVSAGLTISVNHTGNDVFGNPTDTDNLFTVLKGLQNAFSSGNQAAATGYMGLLSSRLDKLVNTRAEVGARTNRLDLIDNRLKDLSVNLEGLSSKVEDADMAETITKLNTEQNVYQASLSTGAKIIQPSLVDYLK